MEDFDYIKFLEEENRYAHGILKKLEDENARMKDIISPPPTIEFETDENGITRRIFKINVGKLPMERAEEYISEIIKKYKTPNSLFHVNSSPHRR